MSRTLERMSSATELNAYAEARLEFLTEQRDHLLARIAGAKAELDRCENELTKARSLKLAAQEKLVTVHGTSKLLDDVAAIRRQLAGKGGTVEKSDEAGADA
jgi:chromosome segregation ATPase